MLNILITFFFQTNLWDDSLGVFEGLSGLYHSKERKDFHCSNSMKEEVCFPSLYEILQSDLQNETLCGDIHQNCKKND